MFPKSRKHMLNIWFVWIVLMGLIFLIPLKALVESQWVNAGSAMSAVQYSWENPHNKSVRRLLYIYIVLDNRDKVG